MDSNIYINLLKFGKFFLIKYVSFFEEFEHCYQSVPQKYSRLTIIKNFEEKLPKMIYISFLKNSDTYFDQSNRLSIVMNFKKC